MREFSAKEIYNILSNYKKGIMITRSNNFTYQRIDGSLKSDVEILLTKLEAEEYTKCKNDSKYFIEEYLGIKLRKYQIKWLDVFNEKRFIIYHVFRQSGISTILSALLLHKLLFFNISVSIHDKYTIDRIWQMYLQTPYFLKKGIISKNKNSIFFTNSNVKFGGSDRANIRIVKNVELDNLPLIGDNDQLIVEVLDVDNNLKKLINNSLRKEGDPIKNSFYTVKTYWWELISEEQKNKLILDFGQDYFDKYFDLNI
jgi:hypothetical protein